MLAADQRYFAQFLNRTGDPYRPVGRIAGAKPPGWFKRLRFAVAKLRGRFPGDDYVDLDQTVLRGLKG